jgi:hypothetical protein
LVDCLCKRRFKLDGGEYDSFLVSGFRGGYPEMEFKKGLKSFGEEAKSDGYLSLLLASL